MEWLLANWFWVLIFLLFIAMHVFGHGGHGGHQHRRRKDPDQGDGAQERIMSTSSSKHRH